MRSLQYTFTGGEVTPEAYGNVGLEVYNRALAVCRNFTLLPHGGAARRQGFLDCGPCDPNPAFSSRFFATYSVTLGNILVELSNSKCRVWISSTDGTTYPLSKNAVLISNVNVGANRLEGNIPATWAVGTRLVMPLEINPLPDAWKPFRGQQFLVSSLVTGAGGWVILKHVQTGAVVSLAGLPNGAPLEMETIDEVVEIACAYSDSYLSRVTCVSSPDAITFFHPSLPSYRLNFAGWPAVSFAAVSFATTQAAPTAPGVTPTPGGPPAGSIAHSYVVTAVNTDRVTESVVTATVTAQNNLTVAGNYNTVNWTAAAGAAFYNIYKFVGGIAGLIGRTSTTSFVDSGLLVDTAVTPAVLNLTLNSAANNYPVTGAFFEQRLMLAGTNAEPDRLWATRSGTESNLTSSTPLREDDAFSVRAVAPARQVIRHLVPLNDVLALSAGGVHRVFANGGGALSFSNITIKPQGSAGAGWAQPSVTPASVLYINRTGKKVREIKYQPEGTGSYRSDEVTSFVPHLTEATKLTRLAYSQEPEQNLWALRADGTLLGMLHEPDSKLYGWHRHDTNGTIKDIVVFVDDGYDAFPPVDALYAVVKRGNHTRLERMARRQWVGVPDPYFSNVTEQGSKYAVFVDGSRTYTFIANQTVIGGLWHLEGLSVQVLADNKKVGPYTVSGGQITLATAAKVVTVGLGYTSQLQTLPWAEQGTEAAGAGKTKNTTQVDIRVKDSSYFKVGQSFTDLFAGPTVPTTDSVPVPVGLGWTEGGQVCIEQSEPLPCTVLSICPNEEFGG